MRVRDGRAHNGERLCWQHPQRVCWVALTKDDHFAYVTNFGDGTVSCYEITGDGSLKLHDPVAGSTGQGQKGLCDEAISGDGRYLYAN